MTSIKITDIKDPADQLTQRLKDSFLNQSAIEAVIINPGDSLWRFVHTKNGRRFSDCWITPETMRDVMSIIRSWGDYSKQTKVNVVRDNLAILSDWRRKYKNSIGQDRISDQVSWRLKITFKKPVVAYVGQTGPQKGELLKEIKFPGDEGYKKVESRIGGLVQVIIPRFGGGISTSTGEQFAEITHFSEL